MIITIDGLAGSGKSSVARELAKSLKYLHLNSGLLYRAVGYLMQSKSIEATNSDEIGRILEGLKFDFILNVLDFHTDIKVFYSPDSRILSPTMLLSDECSEAASKVGTIAVVREYLTRVQRDLGKSNSLVLEGRDSGSVVFPNADFKFYLDASFEERVRRRVVQEQQLGREITQEVEALILKEMKDRDLRDSTRELDPHVVPKDAIVINTQGLSQVDVVEVLKNKISLKG